MCKFLRFIIQMARSSQILSVVNFLSPLPFYARFDHSPYLKILSLIYKIIGYSLHILIIVVVDFLYTFDCSFY
jgi:riboflavin transporter FmnP